MTSIPTWSDCDLTLVILTSPASVSGMGDGQYAVLQAFDPLTATILAVVVVTVGIILAVIGICVYKGDDSLLLIGAYGESDVSQGVTRLHVRICFHFDREVSSDFFGLPISFLAFALISSVSHSFFVCRAHRSLANGVRSNLLLLFISCMAFA